MPERIRLTGLFANGFLCLAFGVMALAGAATEPAPIIALFAAVAGIAGFNWHVIRKAARILAEETQPGRAAPGARAPSEQGLPAMTDRRRISSGSKFEEQIGYSRAVVIGDDIWVSGTTGYDYATMTIAPDVVAQAEQTFGNIAAALAQAGATLDDVVRVLFIVPNRADWEACWPVVKTYLGAARPASTLIHAGLQTDAMKIEIEVTARIAKKA